MNLSKDLLITRGWAAKNKDKEQEREGGRTGRKETWNIKNSSYNPGIWAIWIRK